MIATTVCDDGGPLPRAAVVNVLSLLLRRVTLSGVFVLALVLVWAAVLLPSLLRRHDVALARSAERLSSAVRVLQRPPRRPSPGPGPGAAATPVDLPERVDAGAVPAVGVPGRPLPDTVPAAVPAGEPVRSPRRAPVLAPAARAARRRRRVLVGLLLFTALGVVAGLLAGTAGWVLAGTGAAVLALFLAAAARAARASGGAAVRRGESGAPQVARRRADVPAPRPAAPQLFDQELADQELADQELADLVPVTARAGGVSESDPATVRGPEHSPAPAPAAGWQPYPDEAVRADPAVGPARRRRRPLVAADGTWTPVPVPTPVYLTAARVPYPSTPRRPVPAARPARQPQVVRQRTAAGLGVRRAVGS